MIINNYDTVINSKEQPTEGEVKLLNFLENNLDDSYEIHYKPFLNGLNLDIAILKEGAGVIIINVKDWKLDDYSVKKEGKGVRWYSKKDTGKIMSPFEQIKAIKDSIYEQEIEVLASSLAINKSYYRVVKTLVYFSRSTKEELLGFGGDCLTMNKDLVCEAGQIYMNAITKDMLSKPYLEKILSDLQFKSDYLFDKKLSKSFQSLFTPYEHFSYEGKKIELTKKQNELSQSKPGECKIAGVSGSGKTLTLAFRAVKAFERTGEKVLILTYNCTLIGYIETLMNCFPKSFKRSNYTILNYHEFVSKQLLNVGAKIEPLKENSSKKEMDEYFEKKFSDEKLFDHFKSQFYKYSSIFIDEVQDYDSSWIAILRKFFLKENGELVLFGDEKQNIYKRMIDKTDKRPNTGIPGRWKELSDAKRTGGNISRLMIEFQKMFLTGKYFVDKVESNQIGLFESEVKYFSCKTKESRNEKIFAEIDKASAEGENVVLLGKQIKELREFDWLYRQKTKKTTRISFEYQEEYEKIIKNTKIISEIDEKLKKIRKSRKKNFCKNWYSKDELKISTIQSFKGMEMDNVILLIGEND